MKLKRLLVLGTALCMIFGVGMFSACNGDPAPQGHTQHVDKDNDQYCDECHTVMPNHTHKDEDKDGKCDLCGETVREGNVSYTVTVEIDDKSALSGVKVLFFTESGTSRSTSITDGTATATMNLPAGEYTAYLTGELLGYTYEPVKLTSSSTSATIKATAVAPDADGNVPYQVLVLYPGGTDIFRGTEEYPIDQIDVQLCVEEGQDGIAGTCTSLYFDSNYIAHMLDENEPLLMPAVRYEVHFDFAPEGYTFDGTQYRFSEKGGFMSIELKKA